MGQRVIDASNHVIATEAQKPINPNTWTTLQQASLMDKIIQEPK